MRTKLIDDGWFEIPYNNKDMESVRLIALRKREEYKQRVKETIKKQQCSLYSKKRLLKELGL